MNGEVFGTLRAIVRAAHATGWHRDSDGEWRASADANASLRFPNREAWHSWARERLRNENGSNVFWRPVELTTEEQTALGGESGREWRFIWLDGDGDVCNGRYEPDTATCESCDETSSTDDNWRSVHTSHSRRYGYTESTYCESCADGDEIVLVDGDLYHRDLCVYLQDAGEWTTEQHAQENCYQDSDGDWYSSPRDSDDSDDSDGEESDLDDTGHIYRYGTNVLAKHSWPGNAKQDALVFGVELEVEPKDCTRSGARRIADALGGRNGTGSAYILCADSSLHNHGLEIVTVPQTLEAHQKGAVIPWRAISKQLAESDAMSGQGTENCGMHVHINRKALSALTVGKMMVCVNSPAMRGLIELVAQRSEQTYCVRKPKQSAACVRTADADADHYDALNVGTEHGTLELRIFRGNTRHSRILKNLEFTHALCMFARDSSMRDMETPSALRAFIGARAAVYPNLAKFLTERTED